MSNVHAPGIGSSDMSLPAAFRAAAAAVTSLYKEANDAASNSFKAGYQQCLVDLITHFNIEKISLPYLNSEEFKRDQKKIVSNPTDPDSKISDMSDFDKVKKIRDNQGSIWCKESDISIFISFNAKKNDLDIDLISKTISAHSKKSTEEILIDSDLSQQIDVQSPNHIYSTEITSLQSSDANKPELELDTPGFNETSRIDNDYCFNDQKADVTNTFNFRPSQIKSGNGILQSANINLSSRFSNSLEKPVHDKELISNCSFPENLQNTLSDEKLLDSNSTQNSPSCLGIKRREIPSDYDSFQFNSLNSSLNPRDNTTQPLFGRNAWTLQPNEPPFKKLYRQEEMDIND
ncbi:hypothetical protein AYI70_g1506 [Smittium culicis]|uniref:Uncharacterized protein n=1 Tax=Smittium culicis TaxID=133412 RepID=A0A1R1YCC0_9FUNG|nr:hypothetical protein AYI70_g1506 [Smittium culicis]